MHLKEVIRLRIDHSIRIKISISFKLSPQIKVDLRKKKTHFFGFYCDNTPDFEANVIDIRNPQKRPFTEPKLALFWILADGRIFKDVRAKVF